MRNAEPVSKPQGAAKPGSDERRARNHFRAGRKSISHRLNMCGVEFLNGFSLPADEQAVQDRPQARPERHHEKLRSIPVERFLLTLALGQYLKGTFPNEYYHRHPKAHLFDSRSLQGPSDLTHDTVEVGQVAQT